MIKKTRKAEGIPHMVFVILLGAILLCLGCKQGGSAKNRQVRKDSAVLALLQIYTISNGKGLNASFTTYGARLMSLYVPDSNGRSTNIVLGFNTPDEYAHSTEPYFGATIGRYGNRIAKGRFALDGKTYQITINNGLNALHGGKNGFQSKEWKAEKVNPSTIVFTRLSKDGEEGFPGNLQVKVTYSLTDSNALKIVYEANTDQRTVVNLTNHAFWNLNGEGSGTILHHLLEIDADNYTPIDSTFIPTGKIEKVAHTPFDFRVAKAIGKDIHMDNQQLKNGKGYDHNFVLNNNGNGLHLAAKVVGDQTGVVMEIWTTEPGLQFYSGNFMLSKNKMRVGRDDHRTGFAVETQHFPDSPNEPNFPSTVLSPGEKYLSISEYRFSIRK